MPQLSLAVERIERRFGAVDGAGQAAQRDVLEEARRALQPGGGGVAALGRRALKAVPHLLWGPARVPLDAPTLRAWLGRIDKGWGQAPPRLWYHYILHIDPTDAASLELGAWLATRQEKLSESAQAVSRCYALLEPGQALSTLAAAVCDGQDPVADIATAGVAADALRRSRLAVAVVTAAADTLRRRKPRDPSPMQVIGTFLGAQLGEVLKQADCSAQEGDAAAAAAAEAAVAWCIGMGESDERVQGVLDFVLGLLGDPRTRTRPPRWSHPTISEATRQQVDSWLSRQTFEAFFRVVDATLLRGGDVETRQKWAARKAFWRTYLPQVRKAWLICAPNAALEARKLRVRCGQFVGQNVLTDHSGLLLEIGTSAGYAITALEMSHVGRAVFWAPGAPGLPGAFERQYDRGDILSRAKTLSRDDRTTKVFALTHQGNWPEHFRRRIAERTGIQ
ncbi:EH signature domain-containing protein [Teichococcus coralli]|nr:EH signature domain-containing protein [Pseudoroseomonas coralli]